MEDKLKELIAPEFPVAGEAQCAKPQYGRHKLVKRMRPGTGYYEYTILVSEERAA